MKKIIIIFIIYFLLTIIIFYTINKKNQKILRENKELLIKNQTLRNQTDSLNNLLVNAEYHIYVVEKNSKIKLGEEYEAVIYFTQIPKLYKPKVIVGDYVGDSLVNNLKDTLTVIDEHSVFRYKNTPEKTGKYRWGGTLIFYNINNEKEEYYFYNEFEVE